VSLSGASGLGLKVLFFHQAHLNNWRRFLDQLRGRHWERVWDDVVLTAANEHQAAAFRYQIDLRQRLAMLPTATRFHVIADPEGIRIGSGGATLNVLKRLADEHPDSERVAPPSEVAGPFQGRRILVLHSGGDSKRLPQHSAFGKLFAPIPRLLPSGRPSTLFDELFVALSGLPAAMSAGVVIASGDVLLLFDHSQLRLERPGFTGVAILAPAETASHHGVFLADESGKVRAFLHKPPVPVLRQEGGLDPSGRAAVDTGIVYFTAEMAGCLWREGCRAGAWLEQALADAVPINFYGEFLLALAPNMELAGYLRDDSDGAAADPLQRIRRQIWAVLHGTPFHVEQLQPAKFLHFGTTREYQRLVTYEDDDVRALGGKRRISHFLAAGAAADEHCCILHSHVAEGATLEQGCVVEFSRIGAGCRIGREAVASNLVLPAGTHLPPASVVHGLPVGDLRGGGGHVVRLWGVDDNPKASLPEAAFLGKPLADWMTTVGIEPDELWPEACADDERSLWTARLFPVAASEQDAWEAVQWMLGAPSADRCGGQCPAEWHAARRLSLKTSYETADLAAIGRAHRDLFSQLVLAKCRGLFDAETAVAEWFDKIPTREDLAGLIERMAAATPAMPSDMRRVRWRYSIAALIRSAPAGKRIPELSPEPFETDAFADLARCILGAPGRAGGNRRIVRWERAESAVALPVRVDFAGGWSDTPPHSIERGGGVLNAAVLLDGKLPVHAWCQRLSAPVVRFESRDLDVLAEYRSTRELLDFSDTHDPLGLHKAAFALTTGLAVKDPPELSVVLERLGGGVCLGSEVRLPKGTGLGTSSILAAALARALMELGLPADEEPANAELFAAASAVEQILTTGGGWQDQVGGLVPGVKLATSGPGICPQFDIRRVQLSQDLRRELDRRLVVLDTGQRRLAKNLLREVMGGWLAREPGSVAVLSEVQDIARQMAAALAGGDFECVGRLMWHHWELNKRLDAQTSNPFIDHLMDSLRPHLVGAKLAGAGGGGFMVGIARPAAQNSIAAVLREEFGDTNVRRYESCVAWELP